MIDECEEFDQENLNGRLDDVVRLRDILVIDDGNLPAAVDTLRDLIATSGQFYDRDGPVEIVTDPNGAPVIKKLTKSNVVYIAHQLCQPVKLSAKGNPTRVTLPSRVAEMYLELRGKWKLPGLSGISTAPLLADDGSIRSASGYDTASKLWCHSVPSLSVPEKPTRAQAKAALLTLRRAFRTFPFADSERQYDHELGVEVVDLDKPPGLDESTFLNGLATAVCRPSLCLAPGLLINAPSISGSGSGKGLMVRAIGIIAYGDNGRPFTPGNDRHEMDKRVVADVLEGRPMVSMDNINEALLRSNTICSLLTERPCGLRILGRSQMVHLDQAAFFTFTGNGLTISEDLARRLLLLEFDPRCEDPELRSFKKGFLDSIRESRNELLTAALTIWRWGRRDADKAGNAGLTLGSFEQWGEWVRDPLGALGCSDPVKRVRLIKEHDPKRQRIFEVFATWWAKHGNSSMRVSTLDPDVLHAIDPESKGRQYQARAVGNLVGTRLAGYVLKRTGEIDNKRKEGTLYQLEYRPSTTDGPVALDPSHPHYPHHPQEMDNADDADDTSKPNGGKLVCVQCGQLGGNEWDYNGIAVRLHEGCERPWIEAYELGREEDQQ